MSRGYSVVGLFNPRDHLNIGSALRAARCFDAAMVVVHGKRYRPARTDTEKAHRHMPVVETNDLAAAIPYDCVPVAVEIVDGAIPLPSYKHPERAFYVFGPEDGSIPAHMLARCRDVVSVPAGCLNLAAAVNVVLYDRMAKREVRP